MSKNKKDMVLSLRVDGDLVEDLMKLWGVSDRNIVAQDIEDDFNEMVERFYFE